MRIAVCDVGLGNLRSVARALARGAELASRDAELVVTRDPDALRRADKIVVPGQGAFRDCTAALAGGLGDAVKESIARGAPYLGICLGLQVLFERSAEADGCAGLGVLAGAVERLAGGVDALTDAPLKIPHVGWNVAAPAPRGEARASGAARASILGESPAWFYFVHSYAVVPRDTSIVAATTEHGAPFVSAVAKDNVFACQFHPEKSQSAGLALLARFVAL